MLGLNDAARAAATAIGAGNCFICVNCAAVPEALLESEFFGHERGAFTGAVARNAGAFELADGCTLVLDEIGNMSLHAQVTILHAIENPEIHPLGGSQPIPVDLSIIASTNQVIEQLVREGPFREDLFYFVCTSCAYTCLPCGNARRTCRPWCATASSG